MARNEEAQATVAALLDAVHRDDTHGAALLVTRLTHGQVETALLLLCGAYLRLLEQTIGAEGMREALDVWATV